MDYVSTVKGETRLHLFVQPKARKTGFVGLHDNMIKLAVASSPVDGKANSAVVSFLADFFQLKKNEVAIVSGLRSRRKVCSLGRLEEAAVKKRLGPIISAE